MKEKPKNRELTQMEKLTAGYEDLIKGKELNPDGKQLFEKVIKKAATSKKQRGSK